MYLMDSLAETAAWIRQKKREKDLPLAIFPDLHDRMQGAPRFLFDEASTRTMVEVTLGRPKVLLEAMAHCRIPYPVMWVEWDEKARQRLREIFGHRPTADRPLPDRTGFLVEAEPGGRAGWAVWLWDSSTGPLAEESRRLFNTQVPNIGPIGARFDLDQRFEQSNARLQGLLRGNLARVWKGNPIQLEALLRIWQTAEHQPWREWGSRYVARFLDPLALAHSYADVYGEYIMIWAAVMLLTASRPIIDRRPVSMAKLNKARAKRQLPPRLDHTVVTLHLDQAAAEARRRAPLGYTRKSPRVHLVSSYLARRSDKHWIVQPYWRGEGEVISRHVHVRQ
jgi:hypothetical protein